MKKVGILILCSLSIAAWGQRRERTTLRIPRNTPSVSSDTSYRPQARHRKSTAAASTNDAAAVPQGPGVVQLTLADGQLTAWFVATDTIPAGSAFTAYIATPSTDVNGFLKLGPFSYGTDVTPGTSLLLPKISDFGDFWPTGVTTYDVVVNLNGTNTHNAADFTIGAARNYTDLIGLTPLIYSWSESISNRQVLLTISGNFTSDPVKVVLTDIVVAPSAISLSGDGSAITVNLSKVPGSRLDILNDWQLTIGQAGFSDTRIFTHVPFNPANYDPSPSLQ